MSKTKEYSSEVHQKIILLQRKARILHIFGMKDQKDKQPFLIIFTRGAINFDHGCI